MAARLMRRILVDSARARRNQKRGGGGVRITFDEELPVATVLHRLLISWHWMMRSSTLAKLDQRRSQVIELRFFGGLTVEETAVWTESGARHGDA